MTSLSHRLACAALSRLFEPDDRRMRKGVAAYGPEEFLARLREGRHPTEKMLSQRRRADRLDPERELAWLAGHGGRLLVPGDAEWPAPVDDLDLLGDPERPAPFVLWVRGPSDVAETAARAVAMVGARASTAYGEWVAGNLGCDLGRKGWAVVSGGAHGIDAAAHRGSLAAGMSTLAVLACGVDLAYPPGNDVLFARIAAEGALVSEWPIGATPRRGRFLVRNRVIAALGVGTVVVEAGYRSGSKRTAEDAERLGRPVMAVPGNVSAPMSVGTNQLIREHRAVLVTGAAQVVDVVGAFGADAALLERDPERPRDELGPDMRRVVDAVPASTSLSPTQVAERAGLPGDKVHLLLNTLASMGYVEERAGRYRLARAARAG